MSAKFSRCDWTAKFASPHNGGVGDLGVQIEAKLRLMGRPVSASSLHGAFLATSIRHLRLAEFYILVHVKSYASGKLWLSGNDVSYADRNKGDSKVYTGVAWSTSNVQP